MTTLEKLLDIDPKELDTQALSNHLRAFFKLLGPKQLDRSFSISPALIDYQISLIDEKLSEQINAILHHPNFLLVESSWRSLAFLIERLDFDENILLEYINISKEDLLSDFEDSIEISKSGLFYQLYTTEFGQFGGIPIGAIVANYEFVPNHQDIQLLQYLSAVASMSHAPCLAAAGKEFFGIKSWSDLPDLKDIYSLFESPVYTRWNTFRDHPNSRYIGLTLPGFLLRLPYSENNNAVQSFHFEEKTISDNDFCWGNAAFALVAKMCESFAKYRWCINIVGSESGGKLENLPCYPHEAMRGIQSTICTRALITEKREAELAELGFIPLAIGGKPSETIFYSANSVLRPKHFPKTESGIAAEISFKLSTQFPYMMLMNRLAHYIKIMQRENIGAWRERGELSRELNQWISQYVTAMETPDAQTRSRRPLRMARVDVREIDHNAGWYNITILARPHFKYMGVNFTLSLESRLDRQQPTERTAT